MAAIVVETAGVGWRYGTERPDGAVAWAGVASSRVDAPGFELDGPADLAPTVRLLLAGRSGEDRIRYDLDAIQWATPAAPPPAAARPYQRASAGRSKSGGETLGQRAAHGGGPQGPPPEAG